MKIRILTLNLMALALIIMLPSCQSEKNELQPWNVLLIFSDDLNDWTSVLKGHPQTLTPNIQRLADQSISFTRGYCSAPLCNASRTSIMTGLTPATNGIYDNKRWFREHEKTAGLVTLPQYFKANGYQTAGAGKLFHSPRGSGEVPRKMSDDISWDEQYIGEIGAQAPEPFPEQRLDLPMTEYFHAFFVWGHSPVPKEETHDLKMVQYCANYLQQDHEKPFFLGCGIFRPHLHWCVPEEFFNKFDLEDIILPEVLETDLEDLPEAAKKLIKPLVHGQLVKQDMWREAVRAYLACINFADYCIGTMLDALEDSPYAENTIVILMGDHGYHLGEKEHWTKFTLWERAVRTSYFIKVPGFDPGRCDAPVSLMDLYPTLVDLCGLSEKEGLDGHSIRPLLEDPDAEWEYPALTWFRENNYSVRDERYRYIHYPDGSTELYDHDADPHEWYNLSGKQGSKEITRRLDAWIK